MTDAFDQRWRKLYRHPSTAWQLLPSSTRGLGYHLLQIADDDGSIRVGKDAAKHAEAVARLIQAHRDEYKRIARDVQLLLEDGFVFVEGDRLWIRNFELAQSTLRAFNPSVPPSNDTQEQESREERAARKHRERQARYEDRQRASGTPSAPPSGPDGPSDAGTVSPDALPSQTLPSEKSEEERDSEKTKTTKSAREAAQSSPSAPPSGTASESVRQPHPPDRWELQEILRKHAGESFYTRVTGEGEKSLVAFARHQHEQGGDLRADFEVLGKWIASGEKFDDFAPPKSLQAALGKPSSEGVRDGAGLQKAIATAYAWSRRKATAPPKPPRAPPPAVLSDEERKEFFKRNPLKPVKEAADGS